MRLRIPAQPATVSGRGWRHVQGALSLGQPTLNAWPASFTCLFHDALQYKDR